MPIYEYECLLCGEVTETVQRHMDPSPKCCGKLTKKLVSRTSFSLRGKGWAQDNYGLRSSKGGKSE